MSERSELHWFGAQYGKQCWPKFFYGGMRTQMCPCVCRRKKLPGKDVHSEKCLCFKHLRQTLPADSRALDIAVTEDLEAHADNTGHNKEGHSHQAAGQSEWPHPHLRPAKKHVLPSLKFEHRANITSNLLFFLFFLT